MALFGAHEPNPWQTNDAVHAALAMQHALDSYDTELAARGLPQLRLGIGSHSGLAIAGVIGSHELMEFTVIGRTVNLAARVARLTRVHNVGVLVTAPVHEQLDPRFVLEPALPGNSRRGTPPAGIALHGEAVLRNRSFRSESNWQAKPLEPMPAHEVRGVSDPVLTYAVMGFREAGPTP